MKIKPADYELIIKQVGELRFEASYNVLFVKEDGSSFWYTYHDEWPPYEHGEWVEVETI